jgi:hypothetical protein
MDYNQVQIQKVDNGFVVSTTKVIFGDPRPEQTINVFKTFEEVINYLNPTKVKLAEVK